MTAEYDPEEDIDEDPNRKPPRWYTAVLGAWLFISAFLWHHGPAQFHSTWVVGIVVVVLSFLATLAPWARYLVALAGIWLFFSTLLLPRANPGTTWHNCLMAVAIFGSALNARRTGGPLVRGGRR